MLVVVAVEKVRVHGVEQAAPGDVDGGAQAVLAPALDDYILEVQGAADVEDPAALADPVPDLIDPEDPLALVGVGRPDRDRAPAGDGGGGDLVGAPALLDAAPLADEEVVLEGDGVAVLAERRDEGLPRRLPPGPDLDRAGIGVGAICDDRSARPTTILWWRRGSGWRRRRGGGGGGGSIKARSATERAESEEGGGPLK